MKKQMLKYLLVVIAFTSIWCINAMIIQKGPVKKRVLPLDAYRSRMPQRYHTKAYKPLTWTDQFKEISDRLKQLLFGPDKTYQEVVDEITPLIQLVKTTKGGAMKPLDEFLQKNEAEEIDILLSRLIFTENELSQVNDYTDSLHLRLLVAVANNMTTTIYDNIIEKLVNWSQDNITQLFGITTPIDKNFFLFTLLDSANNRQELIDALSKNFRYIIQRPAGKKFLTLLQENNREVYDKIVPFDQVISASINRKNKKQEMLVNKE